MTWWLSAGRAWSCHGLLLAKKHGVTNVAVLERGWIGGGNSGRNTQVTRSNYFYPESAAFFEHSLKLYERMSRDLNINVMFSQRGVLNLAHSDHDMEMLNAGPMPSSSTASIPKY